MIRSSEIRLCIGSAMNHLGPTVAKFERYVWTGPDEDQFWEFLKRGVVMRQHEAMLAILHMADAAIGHFGVTFLRPAYEELLWLEYLQKNEKLAQELSRCFARHDVAESLDKQNQYLGFKAMQGIGFTQKFVKLFLAQAGESAARLRVIGRELGWRHGEGMPGAKFVAKKIGRESEYNFLYHATSRFVHFSPQEIFRRVWGKSGDVSVSSQSLSNYWSDFAIYWGFQIFYQSLSACGEAIGFNPKDSPITNWDEIKILRPVEMVTAAELQSWATPTRHF
jgi:hypothetical protein